MNRKELALIAIVTFITVITWIAFDIHFTKSSSTITNEQYKQVIQITPAFDMDTIDRLTKREN
jgi:uncharacterized protein YpmB